MTSINFNFLSNSYLIMQQYGQVVIFIEWHLKIDGFTVDTLPV
jgi:hypothetical protein